MEEKIKVALITVSTRGKKGEREDLSGKKLSELAKDNLYDIIFYDLVSDDEKEIIDILIHISDNLNADLIFTTGGTGISPSDLTPDATKKIIDKEVPGISEFIRMQSASKTKRAILSRGISGIRKRTLIINLPGSVKAVEECFSFIHEIIPHALEVLSGKTLDCARC